MGVNENQIVTYNKYNYETSYNRSREKPNGQKRGEYQTRQLIALEAKTTQALDYKLCFFGPITIDRNYP